MAEAASPSSHSSFREEVFAVVASLWDAQASRTARRLQNEVDRTNILAPGLWCLCGTVPSSRLHRWRGIVILPMTTWAGSPSH